MCGSVGLPPSLHPQEILVEDLGGTWSVFTVVLDIYREHRIKISICRSYGFSNSKIRFRGLALQAAKHYLSALRVATPCQLVQDNDD